MSVSQLLTRFTEAYTAFNNGPNNRPDNYNNLLRYLHHDVRIKRVDDPTTVVGIANVIYYLNSTQVDRAPRLSVTNSTEWPLNTDPEIRATIRGNGTYQDNSVAYVDVTGNRHGPSEAFDIYYLFSFTRKTPSDLWLLINAVATPT
jgi:hypothetical protein